MLARVKDWAKRIKRDVIALFLAARDRSHALVCQGLPRAS